MTETAGIDKRWQIFDTADQLVSDTFDKMWEYADKIYADAKLAISDLENAASALEVDNLDYDLVMSSIDVPSYDEFTGNVPASLSITTDFPSSSELSTTLDGAIEAKLLSDITNQTHAISTDVETAIFQRDTERAVLELADARDKVSDDWSKRGFTLPDANLLAAYTVLQTDYTNKRLDVSRDVAIKNFELSDANVKFSVQQGLVYIQTKIEIYKAKIQAEIARIEAIVKAYLGEMEGYKASVEVYKTEADVYFKEYDYQLKVEIARAEAILKQVEILLDNRAKLAQLNIQAHTSVATLTSQMVAGAMSGVNASAQIQANNSANYNYSSDPSY